jgi:glycosyltransferase involved in cell wall biosynthesis
VLSVALMDDLGPASPSWRRWRDYIDATGDIGADRRYYSCAPRTAIASQLLIDGWWPLIHGDQAAWLLELSKRAPIPEDFAAEKIDLFHANHFFTLPFVEKLKGDAPIPVVLETQDIQARQYVLRNRGGFFIPPRTSYDKMLKQELEWMRRADLCVHLNSEEDADFRRLLPLSRHALVFPAVPAVPLARGRNMIIVASDNYANYISMRWFLQEVVPLAGDARVEIYGNIDGGVKKRDPELFEAHRDLFRGRVEDIGAAYAAAGCVLLPTIEGHGLSIKAVEALSCGAPLVATPLAFRGMQIDPEKLDNVTLAVDAADFARCWREAQARAEAGPPPTGDSATRRLYDETFSPKSYAAKLAGIVAGLKPSSLDRAQPLAGRKIALLHPAWHSCGTYQVVLGQIAAYRALGADVWPIAISSDPGFVPGRNWLWRGFMTATPELDSGSRYFGGAPFHEYLRPKFLREVLWPYLHGDQARMRLGSAQRSVLPPDVEAQSFDLIHCNHFFLIPLATRLARGRAPVLLDTHDLQARQYMLFNKRIPWLRPRVDYEDLLAQELAAMREADLLLHLNAQEAAEFERLLPDKRHALLYPATPPAPTGPGGPNILLVASNNAANVESVVWFLREVAPRAPDVSVQIVGNVDAGVKSRAPQDYRRYAHWFAGQVENLAEVYANAKLVLLPTISGHGLSIKSVEALSSGLPMIATPQAMRGMNEAVMTLQGIEFVETAEAFAQLLCMAAERPIPDAATRAASATRAFYDKHFSQDAYCRNLADLVASQLRGG